jgi:hypothetical protein
VFLNPGLLNGFGGARELAPATADRRLLELFRNSRMLFESIEE